MTVLRVVQDSHFVIIEVYFIDESINQSLSVFCIVDVAFAELIKEKTDFIYCWNCICGFLHKNLSFQIIVFLFLLRNVAGTQWGCKKYMNMKHLETMEQESQVG